MSSVDERFRGRGTPGREPVRNATVIKFAGGAATPKATFTRPGTDATQYDAGDLIANDVAAPNVVPLAFVAAREFATSLFILRARLRKSSPSVTEAAFLLHLFTDAPAPVNGDNGALSTNKSAAYLGAIFFASMQPFTDGAWGSGIPAQEGPMIVELAEGSRTIYGLLQAQGAYIPIAGETFEVTLEVQQD